MTGAMSDPGFEAVVSERRRLINLAYRLLGSLAEAEDAVQETYARWYALTDEKRAAIETPAAWLTTVASRICLDVLGSARARRERYVGEWIPEPLPEPTEWISGRTGATADPADRVTLDESVSMAFLVVLESMSPAERVSFVLHDVFRHTFAEIADIVGRTPGACRQLASSARRRIRASQGSSTQTAGQTVEQIAEQTALQATMQTAEQRRLVREFKQAWATLDLHALVAILDPDAITVADGGGNALATPYPIRGADQIADHYLGLARLATDSVSLVERTVNGQPGLVMQHEGVTVTVFAFDVAGGRIRQIWAVRNPDKLKPWVPR